ncbi:LacI family DNA-binding transcriptional regulator [Cohnella cellulosilytica]|uniref:LacI family DNA-binding transcriptional regulator n=1 Tax=Cohnella cellulosilytica TaxID=986710 RepID=A0ABW2FBE2_9BACL
MRKVTIQEIADSLGISRTTVWKVFGGQTGVSQDLRSKIIAKAQELNYTIPEGSYPAADAAAEAPLNIALAVCRPETSTFWLAIIHRIAKELSGHQVNLIYTYLPTSVGAGYTLPASLTNGGTHGIIIINVYDEQLLRLLAASHLPKVFLDTSTAVPSSELNGDLVLTENRASIAQITESLIASGRRSFGFIGDIDYAQSNHERFEGFTKALAQHGLSMDSQRSLTGPIGRDTYKEEISAFVAALPGLPDAFVCANDHVACILMQLLLGRGVRIPEDVAVSGFDANQEYSLADDLTTVQVPNSHIGFRLAQQILFRIKYPNVPYEVISIASQVIFRGSTTASAPGIPTE